MSEDNLQGIQNVSRPLIRQDTGAHSLNPIKQDVLNVKWENNALTFNLQNWEPGNIKIEVFNDAGVKIKTYSITQAERDACKDTYNRLVDSSSRVIVSLVNDKLNDKGFCERSVELGSLQGLQWSKLEVGKISTKYIPSPTDPLRGALMLRDLKDWQKGNMQILDSTGKLLSNKKIESLICRINVVQGMSIILSAVDGRVVQLKVEQSGELSQQNLSSLMLPSFSLRDWPEGDIRFVSLDANNSPKELKLSNENRKALSDNYVLNNLAVPEFGFLLIECLDSKGAAVRKLTISAGKKQDVVGDTMFDSQSRMQISVVNGEKTQVKQALEKSLNNLFKSRKIDKTGQMLLRSALTGRLLCNIQSKSLVFYINPVYLDQPLTKEFFDGLFQSEYLRDEFFKSFQTKLVEWGLQTDSIAEIIKKKPAEIRTFIDNLTVNETQKLCLKLLLINNRDNEEQVFLRSDVLPFLDATKDGSVSPEVLGSLITNSSDKEIVGNEHVQKINSLINFYISKLPDNLKNKKDDLYERLWLLFNGGIIYRKTAQGVVKQNNLKIDEIDKLLFRCIVEFSADALGYQQHKDSYEKLSDDAISELFFQPGSNVLGSSVFGGSVILSHPLIDLMMKSIKQNDGSYYIEANPVNLITQLLKGTSNKLSEADKLSDTEMQNVEKELEVFSPKGMPKTGIKAKDLGVNIRSILIKHCKTAGLWDADMFKGVEPAKIIDYENQLLDYLLSNDVEKTIKITDIQKLLYFSLDLPDMFDAQYLLNLSQVCDLNFKDPLDRAKAYYGFLATAAGLKEFNKDNTTPDKEDPTILLIDRVSNLQTYQGAVPVALDKTGKKWPQVLSITYQGNDNLAKSIIEFCKKQNSAFSGEIDAVVLSDKFYKPEREEIIKNLIKDLKEAGIAITEDSILFRSGYEKSDCSLALKNKPGHFFDGYFGEKLDNNYLASHCLENLHSVRHFFSSSVFGVIREGRMPPVSVLSPEANLKLWQDLSLFDDKMTLDKDWKTKINEFDFVKAGIGTDLVEKVKNELLNICQLRNNIIRLDKGDNTLTSAEKAKLMLSSGIQLASIGNRVVSQKVDFKFSNQAEHVLQKIIEKGLSYKIVEFSGEVSFLDSSGKSIDLKIFLSSEGIASDKVTDQVMELVNKSIVGFSNDRNLLYSSRKTQLAPVPLDNSSYNLLLGEVAIKSSISLSVNSYLFRNDITQIYDEAKATGDLNRVKLDNLIRLVSGNVVNSEVIARLMGIYRGTDLFKYLDELRKSNISITYEKLINLSDKNNKLYQLRQAVFFLYQTVGKLDVMDAQYGRLPLDIFMENVLDMKGGISNKGDQLLVNLSEWIKSENNGQPALSKELRLKMNDNVVNMAQKDPAMFALLKTAGILIEDKDGMITEVLQKTGISSRYKVDFDKLLKIIEVVKNKPGEYAPLSAEASTDDKTIVDWVVRALVVSPEFQENFEKNKLNFLFLRLSGLKSENQILGKDIKRVFQEFKAKYNNSENMVIRDLVFNDEDYKFISSLPDDFVVGNQLSLKVAGNKAAKRVVDLTKAMITLYSKFEAKQFITLPGFNIKETMTTLAMLEKASSQTTPKALKEYLNNDSLKDFELSQVSLLDGNSQEILTLQELFGKQNEFSLKGTGSPRLVDYVSTPTLFMAEGQENQQDTLVNGAVGAAGTYGSFFKDTLLGFGNMIQLAGGVAKNAGISGWDKTLGNLTGSKINDEIGDKELLALIAVGSKKFSMPGISDILSRNFLRLLLKEADDPTKKGGDGTSKSWAGRLSLIITALFLAYGARIGMKKFVMGGYEYRVNSNNEIKKGNKVAENDVKLGKYKAWVFIPGENQWHNRGTMEFFMRSVLKKQIQSIGERSLLTDNPQLAIMQREHPSRFNRLARARGSVLVEASLVKDSGYMYSGVKGVNSKGKDRPYYEQRLDSEHDIRVAKPTKPQNKFFINTGWNGWFGLKYHKVTEVYDPIDLSKVKNIPAFKEFIELANQLGCVSPDGNTLLLGTEGNRVRLEDYLKTKEVAGRDEIVSLMNEAKITNLWKRVNPKGGPVVKRLLDISLFPLFLNQTLPTISSILPFRKAGIVTEYNSAAEIRVLDALPNEFGNSGNSIYALGDKPVRIEGQQYFCDSKGKTYTRIKIYEPDKNDKQKGWYQYLALDGTDGDTAFSAELPKGIMSLDKIVAESVQKGLTEIVKVNDSALSKENGSFILSIGSGENKKDVTVRAVIFDPSVGNGVKVIRYGKQNMYPEIAIIIGQPLTPETTIKLSEALSSCQPENFFQPEITVISETKLSELSTNILGYKLNSGKVERVPITDSQSEVSKTGELAKAVDTLAVDVPKQDSPLALDQASSEKDKLVQDVLTFLSKQEATWHLDESQTKAVLEKVKSIIDSKDFDVKKAKVEVFSYITSQVFIVHHGDKIYTPDQLAVLNLQRLKTVDGNITVGGKELVIETNLSILQSEINPTQINSNSLKDTIKIVISSDDKGRIANVKLVDAKGGNVAGVDMLKLRNHIDSVLSSSRLLFSSITADKGTILKIGKGDYLEAIEASRAEIELFMKKNIDEKTMEVIVANQKVVDSMEYEFVTKSRTELKTLHVEYLSEISIKSKQLNEMLKTDKDNAEILTIREEIKGLQYRALALFREGAVRRSSAEGEVENGGWRTFFSNDAIAEIENRTNGKKITINGITCDSFDNLTFQIEQKQITPQQVADWLERECGLKPKKIFNGIRMFKEQTQASIAMLDGKIVELPCGAGKTKSQGATNYVLSLFDVGVFSGTATPDLALKDFAEIRADIFYLTQDSNYVGCIEGIKPNRFSPEGFALHKKAYSARITYGTGTEMGFDLLTDIKGNSLGKMMRGTAYAVIDEIDQELIEKAINDLILSGEKSAKTPISQKAYLGAYELIFRDLNNGKNSNVLSENGIIKAGKGGMHYIAKNFSEIIKLIDNRLSATSITPETKEWLQEFKNLIVENPLRAVEVLDSSVDVYFEHGTIGSRWQIMPIPPEEQAEAKGKKVKVELISEQAGSRQESSAFQAGTQQALEAQAVIMFGQNSNELKFTEETATSGRIKPLTLYSLFGMVVGGTGTLKSHIAELQQNLGVDVAIFQDTVPTRIQKIDGPIYWTGENLQKGLKGYIDDLSKKAGGNRRSPIIIAENDPARQQKIAIDLWISEYQRFGGNEVIEVKATLEQTVKNFWFTQAKLTPDEIKNINPLLVDESVTIDQFIKELIGIKIGESDLTDKLRADIHNKSISFRSLLKSIPDKLQSKIDIFNQNKAYGVRVACLTPNTEVEVMELMRRSGGFFNSIIIMNNRGGRGIDWVLTELSLHEELFAKISNLETLTMEGFNNIVTEYKKRLNIKIDKEAVKQQNYLKEIKGELAGVNELSPSDLRLWYKTNQINIEVAIQAKIYKAWDGYDMSIDRTKESKFLLEAADEFVADLTSNLGSETGDVMPEIRKRLYGADPSRDYTKARLALVLTLKGQIEITLIDGEKLTIKDHKGIEKLIDLVDERKVDKGLVDRKTTISNAGVTAGLKKPNLIDKYNKLLKDLGCTEQSKYLEKVLADGNIPNLTAACNEKMNGYTLFTTDLSPDGRAVYDQLERRVGRSGAMAVVISLLSMDSVMFDRFGNLIGEKGCAGDFMRDALSLLNNDSQELIKPGEPGFKELRSMMATLAIVAENNGRLQRNGDQYISGRIKDLFSWNLELQRVADEVVILTNNINRQPNEIESARKSLNNLLHDFHNLQMKQYINLYIGMTKTDIKANFELLAKTYGVSDEIFNRFIDSLEFDSDNKFNGDKDKAELSLRKAVLDTLVDMKLALVNVADNVSLEEVQGLLRRLQSNTSIITFNTDIKEVIERVQRIYPANEAQVEINKLLTTEAVKIFQSLNRTIIESLPIQIEAGRKLQSQLFFTEEGLSGVKVIEIDGKKVLEVDALRYSSYEGVKKLNEILNKQSCKNYLSGMGLTIETAKVVYSTETRIDLTKEQMQQFSPASELSPLQYELLAIEDTTNGSKFSITTGEGVVENIDGNISFKVGEQVLYSITEAELTAKKAEIVSTTKTLTEIAIANGLDINNVAHRSAIYRSLLLATSQNNEPLKDCCIPVRVLAQQLTVGSYAEYHKSLTERSVKLSDGSTLVIDNRIHDLILKEVLKQPLTEAETANLLAFLDSHKAIYDQLHNHFINSKEQSEILINEMKALDTSLVNRFNSYFPDIKAIKYAQREALPMFQFQIPNTPIELQAITQVGIYLDVLTNDLAAPQKLLTSTEITSKIQAVRDLLNKGNVIDGKELAESMSLLSEALVKYKAANPSLPKVTIVSPACLEYINMYEQTEDQSVKAKILSALANDYSFSQALAGVSGKNQYIWNQFMLEMRKAGKTGLLSLDERANQLKNNINGIPFTEVEKVCWKNATRFGNYYQFYMADSFNSSSSVDNGIGLGVNLAHGFAMGVGSGLVLNAFNLSNEDYTLQQYGKDVRMQGWSWLQFEGEMYVGKLFGLNPGTPPLLSMSDRSLNWLNSAMEKMPNRVGSVLANETGQALLKGTAGMSGSVGKSVKGVFSGPMAVIFGTELMFTMGKLRKEGKAGMIPMATMSATVNLASFAGTSGIIEHFLPKSYGLSLIASILVSGFLSEKFNSLQPVQHLGRKMDFNYNHNGGLSTIPTALADGMEVASPYLMQRFLSSSLASSNAGRLRSFSSSVVNSGYRNRFFSIKGGPFAVAYEAANSLYVHSDDLRSANSALKGQAKRDVILDVGSAGVVLAAAATFEAAALTTAAALGMAPEPVFSKVGAVIVVGGVVIASSVGWAKEKIKDKYRNEDWAEQMQNTFSRGISSGFSFKVRDVADGTSSIRSSDDSLGAMQKRFTPKVYEELFSDDFTVDKVLNIQKYANLIKFIDKNYYEFNKSEITLKSIFNKLGIKNISIPTVAVFSPDMLLQIMDTAALENSSGKTDISIIVGAIEPSSLGFSSDGVTAGFKINNIYKQVVTSDYVVRDSQNIDFETGEFIDPDGGREKNIAKKYFVDLLFDQKLNMPRPAFFQLLNVIYSSGALASLKDAYSKGEYADKCDELIKIMSNGANMLSLDDMSSSWFYQQETFDILATIIYEGTRKIAEDKEDSLAVKSLIKALENNKQLVVDMSSYSSPQQVVKAIGSMNMDKDAQIKFIVELVSNPPNEIKKYLAENGFVGSRAKTAFNSLVTIIINDLVQFTKDNNIKGFIFLLNNLNTICKDEWARQEIYSNDNLPKFYQIILQCSAFKDKGYVLSEQILKGELNVGNDGKKWDELFKGNGVKIPVCKDIVAQLEKTITTLGFEREAARDEWLGLYRTFVGFLVSRGDRAGLSAEEFAKLNPALPSDRITYNPIKTQNNNKFVLLGGIAETRKERFNWLVAIYKTNPSLLENKLDSNLTKLSVSKKYCLINAVKYNNYDLFSYFEETLTEDSKKDPSNFDWIQTNVAIIDDALAKEIKFYNFAIPIQKATFVFKDKAYTMSELKALFLKEKSEKPLSIDPSTITLIVTDINKNIASYLNGTGVHQHFFERYLQMIKLSDRKKIEEHLLSKEFMKDFISNCNKNKEQIKDDPLLIMSQLDKDENVLEFLNTNLSSFYSWARDKKIQIVGESKFFSTSDYQVVREIKANTEGDSDFSTNLKMAEGKIKISDGNTQDGPGLLGRLIAQAGQPGPVSIKLSLDENQKLKLKEFVSKSDGKYVFENGLLKTSFDMTVDELKMLSEISIQSKELIQSAYNKQINGKDENIKAVIDVFVEKILGGGWFSLAESDNYRMYLSRSIYKLTAKINNPKIMSEMILKLHLNIKGVLPFGMSWDSVTTIEDNSSQVRKEFDTFMKNAVADYESLVREVISKANTEADFLTLKDSLMESFYKLDERFASSVLHSLNELIIAAKNKNINLSDKICEEFYKDVYGGHPVGTYVRSERNVHILSASLYQSIFPYLSQKNKQLSFPMMLGPVLGRGRVAGVVLDSFSLQFANDQMRTAAYLPAKMREETMNNVREVLSSREMLRVDDYFVRENYLASFSQVIKDDDAAKLVLSSKEGFVNLLEEKYLDKDITPREKELIKNILMRLADVVCINKSASEINSLLFNDKDITFLGMFILNKFLKLGFFDQQRGNGFPLSKFDYQMYAYIRDVDIKSLRKRIIKTDSGITHDQILIFIRIFSANFIRAQNKNMVYFDSQFNSNDIIAKYNGWLQLLPSESKAGLPASIKSIMDIKDLKQRSIFEDYIMTLVNKHELSSKALSFNISLDIITGLSKSIENVEKLDALSKVVKNFNQKDKILFELWYRNNSNNLGAKFLSLVTWSDSEFVQDEALFKEMIKPENMSFFINLSDDPLYKTNIELFINKLSSHTFDASQKEKLYSQLLPFFYQYIDKKLPRTH